jgi:hypothetical protein
MSLDVKLKRRVQQALSVVDDHSVQGPRLMNDAQRLWARVQQFIKMRLVTAEPDLDAMELACHALQLPLRQIKLLSPGRLGRINLKDRAEHSAELLLSVLEEAVDESLLDRTARLLHELPHRSPMLEEAKLLADAVNLEDFGVTGMFAQMVQLGRQGEGVVQLAEGMVKREQYGYWDARLKDGFHFQPVRQMALRRLEHARHVAKLLAKELQEDQP